MDQRASYPREVVTTLEDLVRFEWLVQSRRLLPSHPVYSILAGRHASRLRGRGLDFEEVRQYIAGDDIRYIDWRVTARTGSTHTKVFNEERERPGFIVLDQGSPMYFGSQRFFKSVTAAHIAALGAFYTVRRGDRVGGIVFNEDGYDYYPPRRNKESLQFYLQGIVGYNGRLPQRRVVQQNTSTLNEMLKRTASLVTHDYVINVISDLSAMDDGTRECLKKLSYHNDVILVHVYDPLEESLPDGRLVLTDGRSQMAWDNHRRHAPAGSLSPSDSLGAAYRKDFRALRAQLTEEFRQTRIPVVFFNTVDPVEDQVTRHMSAYG